MISGIRQKQKANIVPSLQYPSLMTLGRYSVGPSLAVRHQALAGDAEHRERATAPSQLYSREGNN